MKRGNDTLPQPRRYDVAVAKRSLEESLRQLGTEYVDVLFLHDPGAADIVEVDELRDFLEGLRKEGTIRAWGVSGDGARCLSLTDTLRGSVPQLRRSIVTDRSALTTGRRSLNLFGVLQPSLDRLSRFATGSTQTTAHQCALVGADLRNRDILARYLIAEAMDAACGGLVIVGTTNIHHLGTAVTAASLPSESVSAFRDYAALAQRGQLAR